MARRKAKRRIAEPEWKTKWPRGGDEKAWLRCVFQKCEAIEDDREAADESHLPIEHLAEAGDVKGALRHVNRFLRRLPKEEVLETVRMAELGAEICLNAGDMEGVEKYLAIAEATEPFNTRKCDKGFSINSVREFRVWHGILDPADAVDDKERREAEYRRASRQFRVAMAGRRRKGARKAAAEMEKLAPAFNDPFLFVEPVIKAYVELKDAKSVRRCLRTVDKEDHDLYIDFETMVKIGMTKEAIVRAKQEIGENLDQLGAMTDPNIHFPVSSICEAIQFLAEAGETGSAKHWLRRSLREMPAWPVIEQGWTTSAVYNSFAGVMAVVEGPDAAEELLELALADGKAERRSDFRKGAVKAAVSRKAELDGLEAALSEARKIRSPTTRREELTTLLAGAKRWKELREVLCQVASPEEAAELAKSICWGIWRESRQ